MFVWYWCTLYQRICRPAILTAKFAWTEVSENDDIIRPSDSCLMVPPDGWDCD